MNNTYKNEGIDKSTDVLIKEIATASLSSFIDIDYKKARESFLKISKNERKTVLSEILKEYKKDFVIFGDGTNPHLINFFGGLLDR
jgi:hypothetical protein